MKLNFNPNEHSPAQDFSVIPSGWYIANIVDSEVKDTKSGNGMYLSLTFEISENNHPEVGKRKVFANLNIVNPNEKAQQIGLGQLSAICKALGITDTIVDTDILHHQPIGIKIGMEKGRDGYDDKNKVMAYRHADNHADQQKKSEPNTSSKPPWMSK